MTDELIIKEMLRRVLSNQKIMLNAQVYNPGLTCRGVDNAIKETKRVLRRSILCPKPNKSKILE